MKPKTAFLKKSSSWTLALGVVIGGASMYSMKSFPGVSNAYADQEVNRRLAGVMSSESMATLKSLDNSFASLAEAVEPAVVNIHVKGKAKPGLMSIGGGAVEGAGSGVIIRPDGYILTNDHVVDGMDSVTVTMTDGREFPGKVIRGDGTDDIAVVKIEANNLPTLPFADSNKIRPGQISMAVGSPFDLANSVSIGHVSGLDRQQLVEDPHGGQARGYPDLIQTDAAINPGNSGGALVDIDGELIGINTMIASHSGSSSGVGFAIPSNQARIIADMLIEKGKITRAFIGIEPAPLTQVEQQQLGVTSGAYVKSVPQGTPGEKAGFQKGDVIVRVGSTPIVSFMDVRDVMYKYAAGDQVKIEVVRDGKHKELTVTLEALPKPVQQPRQQMQLGDPFGGDGNQFPFRFRFPDQGGSQGTQPQARTGGTHLGATIGPVNSDTRSEFGLPSGAHGIVVESVEPGSVAENIGLKPGDVITQFNGKDVTTPDAMVKQIHAIALGDPASITFERWSGAESHATISKRFSFQ